MWDRRQLNPTYTRRISKLSTPQPMPPVDKNDILLIVGFSYNFLFDVKVTGYYSSLQTI